MAVQQNGQSVQWPVEAVGDSDDLASPTQELLTSLGFMAFASDEVEVQRFGTPYSLQVIKAGALSLSKVWSSTIAGVGGLTGLVAWAAKPWAGASDSVKVTYVGAAAFLLAAVALAVALIVRADVSARARAAQAEYLGRAQVAVAFLQASQSLTPAPQHWVSKAKSGDQLAVRALEVDEREGVLFVTAQDKIPADAIKRAGTKTTT